MKSTIVSVIACAIAAASLGVTVHTVNSQPEQAAPVAAQQFESSAITQPSPVEPAPLVEPVTAYVPPPMTLKRCDKMGWFAKSNADCKRIYKGIKKMAKQWREEQTPVYREPLVNGVPAWVAQQQLDMRISQLERQQQQRWQQLWQPSH